MTKFIPGDLIIEIKTGEEFWVTDVSVIYGLNSSTTYGITSCRNGAKYEIVGDAISNYRHSQTFGLAATTSPNNTINLDDIEMEQVKFDDTHLKLQKMLPSKDCDHDWVTWTGLHGTQTDCSKCKEVKND